MRLKIQSVVLVQCKLTYQLPVLSNHLPEADKLNIIKGHICSYFYLSLAATCYKQPFWLQSGGAVKYKCGCILDLYLFTVRLLICYRAEDAIPDFESVLKLNKESACAHVNLGLIMMNHYENNHR